MQKKDRLSGKSMGKQEMPQNAFANLIGLKITEISDGHCTEMDITDDMKNPIQSVHGGVLLRLPM